MAVVSPPLPAVGGSSDTWGQILDDAVTNLIGQLSHLDNTADADKPISTATAAALATKAPIGSPALTGVPTAPTAPSGTRSTQIATTEFVANSVGSGGGGTAAPDATTTTNGLVRLAGDLSGFASAPTLTPTGVTAGTYGTANAIPTFTVDAKGRIVSAGSVAVSGGSGGSGSLTYLSTPGSVSANTTAINNALAAAYSAGGGEVRCGPGTWQHTGIIFPPGGKVILSGVSVDGTIFQNMSTTAASISALGVGSGANPSRPYAQGWAMRDFTVTTSGAPAGQVGIDVALAVQYEMKNVHVVNHDIGFRFNSVWECSHVGLTATSFGSYGYRYIAGYAGSTPTTFFSCNALDGTTGTGLSVEGDANALGWFGGDFVNNNIGWSVTATTARLINANTVNFEGQHDRDIVIGNSSGGPGTVNVYGCRFFRGGAAGVSAIDFQAGAQLNVSGSYFGNYAQAMKQSNLTARMKWDGIVADSLTNVVVASNGNYNTSSGEVVPSGFITSDSYGGLKTSLGLGVTPGDRTFRMTYGYNLSGGDGANGDFYIRGDGAAGARGFLKIAGAWTAIF